jgi:hypothetical protein
MTEHSVDGHAVVWAVWNKRRIDYTWLVVSAYLTRWSGGCILIFEATSDGSCRLTDFD